MSGPNGPLGRNGIDIWADNVSVDNLTICNFQLVENSQGNQVGNGGNEIWWDGGDNTGKIGVIGYEGSYLTATDTFNGTRRLGLGLRQLRRLFRRVPGTGHLEPDLRQQLLRLGELHRGLPAGVRRLGAQRLDGEQRPRLLGHQLGRHPGRRQLAVRRQRRRVRHQHPERRRSAPAPERRLSRTEGISAFTQTHSCWVFMNNFVHDNNNPKAPGAGLSGEPVGTGMTVSGARNDTIMDNTFADNDAWGTLFVPFPDSDAGPPGVCAGSGGKSSSLLPGYCVYDPQGDALLDNTYSGNGAYGNPTNGDFGQITLFSGEGQNCFGGNNAPNGFTPTNLEQAQPPSSCGITTTAANTGGELFTQVLCDTGFAGVVGISCTGANYPKPSTPPTMTSVPTNLPTMPNPCAGVPDNPWCVGGKPAG